MFQDDYSDEKDNVPLLPGGGESKPREMPSFFSIEFYRKCWDVTTNEVRLRVKSACYPRGDFISSLHGKPDLYGPFWVSGIRDEKLQDNQSVCPFNKVYQKFTLAKSHTFLDFLLFI